MKPSSIFSGAEKGDKRNAMTCVSSQAPTVLVPPSHRFSTDFNNEFLRRVGQSVLDAVFSTTLLRSVFRALTNGNTLALRMPCVSERSQAIFMVRMMPPNQLPRSQKLWLAIRSLYFPTGSGTSCNGRAEAAAAPKPS